tara:strand:+ start:507 stop:1157 length:651 start_codon:yes stop_codon:yes gene_type:complete
MRVVPPITFNLVAWAENLRRYLSKALNQLDARDSYATAAEDGVLLWDRENGYPVVSKNGEWRQIVLEGGNANFIKTADVTAALANTAYKITYDAPAGNSGITQGTPASRIVFEEAGEYVLAFSAQVSSTSASTVLFYFWPSINGVDAANSGMATALHQNNATLVTSRTQIFTVAAGDYLEVNYMFDNTNGFLNYTAAASPVPAIPASTLSITRLHG